MRSLLIAHECCTVYILGQYLLSHFVVMAFTKIHTPAYKRTPVRACLFANGRPVYCKLVKGKTLAYRDQLEIILYEIKNAILALDKIQQHNSLMKAEQYFAFLAGLGRNQV